MLHEALDFFFPLNCFVCQKTGSLGCLRCLSGLPSPQLFCLVCQNKNPLGLTCSSCKTAKSPDQLVARFCYKGEIKKLISEAKYNDAFANLDPLSVSLAKMLKKIIKDQPFIISYIPISLKKLRSRGYDQSKIIATKLGEQLNIEVCDLLVRKNQEHSQVEVDSRELRKKNVKGIFQLKRDKKITENLILVDDIVTTGSTFLEATKQVKKIAKSKVVCVCLAH